MTERPDAVPESIHEALDDYDVTLAMTPGQLVLVVLGIYLLIRFLRGLRG
jgi:hypothetical protein